MVKEFNPGVFIVDKTQKKSQLRINTLFSIGSFGFQVHMGASVPHDSILSE